MNQETDLDPLGRLLRYVAEQREALEECERAAAELAERTEGSRAPDLMIPLGSLLQQLCSSGDEAAAVDSLAHMARALLPDTSGTIMVRDEDGDLRLAGAWRDTLSWTTAALPAEELSRLANTQSKDSRRVPLRNLGLAVGEIRVWGEHVPPARLQLLTAAGSLALGNLQLQRRLKEQSVRDPLTGLFNRRYLEDTLAREIHRARRSNGELGLILLALDNLERFNRRHGREAGDSLLQAVAGVLQSGFRSSDVCCRYDDKHFVVLLPDASLDHSLRRAREATRLIAEIRAARLDSTVDSAAVCAGVAAFPSQAVGAEELLDIAEAALERARDAGAGSTRIAPHFVDEQQAYSE